MARPDQPMPRVTWQEFNRRVIEGIREDKKDREDYEKNRDQKAYLESLDDYSLLAMEAQFEVDCDNRRDD